MCDLPEKFVIAQNWVSLRKTFAIVKAPKDLEFQNFTMNNTAQNFSKNISKQVENLHGMSFNHIKDVLGHFKVRLLSIRGLVGFPRVKFMVKSREVGGSDAVGSWTPGMMLDYRFVFHCGDEIYFIREKRTGVLSSMYKRRERAKDPISSVVYEVFQTKTRKKAWHFSNGDAETVKVLTVKIEKKPLVVNLDKSISVITTAKFYDGQTGKIIRGTGFQRITYVKRDWLSGVRSKFLVQNTTKHSGFLIGFFGYLVAWKEFYNAYLIRVQKAEKKVRNITMATADVLRTYMFSL